MENIEKIKSKVYKLVMLVDELEEEIKMYEWLSTKHFNRPYAKRYLKEKRKEIPNLAYPDSEMVYMDYYKLKERNDKAIRFIVKNCITSNEWTELDNHDFIPTGDITYKPLSSAKVKELLITLGSDKE